MIFVICILLGQMLTNVLLLLCLIQKCQRLVAWFVVIGIFTKSLMPRLKFKPFTGILGFAYILFQRFKSSLLRISAFFSGRTICSRQREILFDVVAPSDIGVMPIIQLIGLILMAGRVAKFSRDSLRTSCKSDYLAKPPNLCTSACCLFLVVEK